MDCQFGPELWSWLFHLLALLADQRDEVLLVPPSGVQQERRAVVQPLHSEAEQCFELGESNFEGDVHALHPMKCQKIWGFQVISLLSP